MTSPLHAGVSSGLDGRKMLLRLRSADEGAEADAYSDMLSEARGFLDALARAAPTPEEVQRVRDDLGEMRRLLEPRAATELLRPFGRGRKNAARAQCLVPHIVDQEVDAERYRATVRLGDFFLGMNGAAHGGVIPLIFDEALGYLAGAGDRPPARTAYLNTTFRAVTPVGVDLRVEARIDRIEGRKRFVTGAIYDGETLCAEAEALFVELRPGQP